MSSDNIAIYIRNPGKKFQPGGPQEKYLTLRDAKSQFSEITIQAISSRSPYRGFLDAKGCFL
jgi:hypothetical protein